MDFESLSRLLGPTGPLLENINRLNSDPFLRYALPKKFSTNSTENIDPNGESLKVSAFEYYCYRFASFVTEFDLIHSSSFSAKTALPDDHIYHSLLGSYLEHFLPFDGFFPVEKSSLTHHYDTISSTSRSPSRSTSLLRRPLSTLKSNTIERPQPGQTWRSETLLTILSEQYLSHRKEGCPFEDQIRALRTTIKHLHTYDRADSLKDGFDRSRDLSIDQSRIAAEITSKFYEVRFWKFISFCMEKWPLQSSFRIVYETWLSYIQPWRYQTEHKRLPDHIASDNDWQLFVERNINCYITNLNDVMRRLLRTDLSRKENAQALVRIGWIFSQPNLMQMIINCTPSNTESFSGFADRTTACTTASKMEENVSLAKELMRSIAMSRSNIQKALEKVDGDENWLIQFLTKFGLFGDFSKSSQEIEAEKLCKELEAAGGHFSKMFDLHDEMKTFFTQKDGSSEFIADHVDTSFGPRLTERGRSQVLSGKYRIPVVSWYDPDFEAPIRNDEIAFLVTPLVKYSLATEDSPVLVKCINLPRFLGHFARFAFCHWNPVAAEWSSPRVKCRMLSSLSVAFWLFTSLFVAAISGWWMFVMKYYLIISLALFIVNFAALRFHM